MEPERITIDEVKKRMDKGEQIFFIDTRNQHDWDESHVKIPGAIRLHISVLEYHLEQVSHGRTIVPYCT